MPGLVGQERVEANKGEGHCYELSRPGFDEQSKQGQWQASQESARQRREEIPQRWLRAPLAGLVLGRVEPKNFKFRPQPASPKDRVDTNRQACAKQGGSSCYCCRLEEVDPAVPEQPGY